MRVMNTERPLYKKLSSKFYTPFIRSSVWKGPDHLLWVDRVVMQEWYKRFYYRDIQSLLLVKNNNQHVWTFVWGAFALLFGLAALFASGTPYVRSVFFGLFIILLCVNLFMGPCCRTYIQTAVQREKLKHLVRVRKAQKVLNDIKALVEEEQGVLFPDQIAQNGVAIEAAQIPAVGDELSSEGSQKISDVDEKDIHAHLHWCLFGMLCFVGGAKYLQTWLQSPVLTVFEIAGLAITMVLGIITLARWRGKKASAELLTFDWIALAIVIVQSIAFYIIYTMASIRNVTNNAMPYDFWGILKTFIQMLNEGNMAITAMVLGFGLANITIGIIGMMLLIRRKK